MSHFDIPIQPIGSDIISNSANANDWIALWDAFVLGKTHITKTDLGLDQSAAYHIYSYEFNRNTNAKTIILSSLCHGTEYIAPKLLYRLMLLIDSGINSQLLFLRDHFRIIVVPVLNPWGRTNNNYNNQRNVNLNRNYGTQAEWNASADPNKGASWKSEAETIIMDTLFSSRNPFVYIDVHNTNSILNFGYSYAYRNGSEKTNTILHDICSNMEPLAAITPLSSTSPMLINAAVATYSSIAAGIDWVPTGLGDSPAQSANDMTHGIEMLANFLFVLASYDANTSISIPTGASNALRIKQKQSYVPSSRTDFINWFNYVSFLTPAKFATFKTVANSDNKLMFVDARNELECMRFIDSRNYGIWFRGNSEQGKEYLLFTGTGLNISNSVQVFSGESFSIGFLETSGNPTDRIGSFSPIAYNILSRIYASVLDNGWHFNGNNSYVSVGNVLSSVQKFTIHAVMHQHVVNATDRFFRILNGSNIFQVGTTDNGLFMYLGTVASYAYLSAWKDGTVVAANENFLLSIVYDGSLTGNSNRLKLYVNGIKRTLGFSGTIPATTPNFGASLFTITTSDTALDGMFDEFDVISGTAQQDDDILVIYNQFFKLDYCTVTIQPIISKITIINNNTLQIEGTGLRPELTNPSGTIDGIPFVVNAGATDTKITIISAINLSAGNHDLVITNSDREHYDLSINIKSNAVINPTSIAIGLYL